MPSGQQDVRKFNMITARLLAMRPQRGSKVDLETRSSVEGAPKEYDYSNMVLYGLAAVVTRSKIGLTRVTAFQHEAAHHQAENLI